MTIPRALGLALAASLLVNVFLAAAILAQSFFHRGPPPPGGLAERMARDLEPADAAILRQAFDRTGERLDRLHRLKRDGFDKVPRALEAQPFDPLALRAAFAEGEAAHAEMGQVIAETVVEAATAMSPDGRRRLARMPPPGGPPPPR